jgi:putative ABC transport system substrate-binding protein
MTITIGRRQLISALGGAAIWPRVTRAQQAKLPTVGFLSTTTQSIGDRSTIAFVQRLRELGWIEGRTRS